MQTRSTLIAIILFVALIGTANAVQAEVEQGVAHVVLIWLKEPGNALHRETIISESKKLKSIPGVLDLQVGEVIPSERDVVDDSYDEALYLRFANQKALQSYLVHPSHLDTLKTKFAPIMGHYRVFDFHVPAPLEQY